jgi:hypothetical protein
MLLLFGSPELSRARRFYFVAEGRKPEEVSMMIPEASAVIP